MNPEYYLLPLALLCLWTPAVVVSSAEVREKLRQQVRRHDDGFTSLFRNWVNWLDLVRSAAGAWMLQRVVSTFSVGQDDLTTIILCAHLAILAMGVLAQTMWFSQKPLVIGPAFYLVGLTLVVCGPQVGFFGLALGYTCALMLRRLSLSFFFIPASLVAFALLFHRFGMMTVFNATAFALPVLLAFALGERIAYARRPVKSRQVGYVYGGSYIPAEPMAQPRTKSTIPSKEDVPSRNFETVSPLGVLKPNGRLSQMAPVLNHFPTQERTPLAAKPTAIPSVTR
jgi:hypothetical protein